MEASLSFGESKNDSHGDRESKMMHRSFPHSSTHNKATSPILPWASTSRPLPVKISVCSLILFGPFLGGCREGGKRRKKKERKGSSAHSHCLSLYPCILVKWHMLISSIHFWCKIRIQLFLSLVLFHSVVFSLSSNYKCFLIAFLPSGLLRSLFEICRLISTSLAKSPQWLGLDFNVLATERKRELRELMMLRHGALHFNSQICSPLHRWNAGGYTFTH